MLLALAYFLIVAVGIAGAAVVFHETTESLKAHPPPVTEKPVDLKGVAIGAPRVYPALSLRKPVNHGPGRFR